MVSPVAIVAMVVCLIVGLGAGIGIGYGAFYTKDIPTFGLLPSPSPPPPSPPSAPPPNPGFVTLYFSVKDSTPWSYYGTNGMASITARGGELPAFGPCRFYANTPTFGRTPFGKDGSSELCGVIKFPTVAIAKEWAQSSDYQYLVPTRNAGADAIFVAFESVLSTTSNTFTVGYQVVIISASVRNQTASDKYDELAFPLVIGQAQAGIVAFSGQLPAVTYLTDIHYPWAQMPGNKLELYLEFPPSIDVADFFNNNTNDYAATTTYRDQGLDAIYGFIDPTASMTLSPPPSPPDHGVGGPGYINMYFSIENATAWGYYAVNGMASVLQYDGTLEFVGDCNFAVYNSEAWGVLPHGLTSNQVCGMLKFPTMARAHEWSRSPEYAQMIPYRNLGTSTIFSAYENIWPESQGYFAASTNSSYDHVMVSATVVNQTASDLYDQAAFPVVLGAGGKIVAFSGQIPSLTFLTEKYYPYVGTGGNMLELVLQFPRNTAQLLFTNNTAYLASVPYRDAGITGVYGFVDAI